MLIVNLAVEEGLVNGTQGTVAEFDEGYYDYSFLISKDGWPIVKFSNGASVRMQKYIWLRKCKGGGTFSGLSISQVKLSV
jgi:hypothetical protein